MVFLEGIGYPFTILSDYKNNRIYFLGRYCGSHCPSSRSNKFFNQNKNITASMLDNSEEDSVLPNSAFDTDISDSDLCAAMIDSEETSTDVQGKEEIINKHYSDLKIVYEKKQAENLPPHRDYDIAIELIPRGQLFLVQYTLLLYKK